MIRTMCPLSHPLISHPLALLLLLAPLLLLTPSRVRAQAAAPSTTQPVAAQGAAVPASAGEFHVLYTADIDGRYAWPGCEKRPTDRADLPHLVTAVREAKAAIRARGGADPLVVATGNMIRPDVLGSHIFSASEHLAGRAVELLSRVGFHAVSVGRYDLGARPDTLRRFRRLMGRAQIPLLLSNVTCKDTADFRCRSADSPAKPYIIYQGQGLRVGVLSVVPEDVAQLIRPETRGSMVVEAPLTATQRLIKELRGPQRVDLVVLLANLNLADTAAHPTIRLARRLLPARPDLIVADTMYSADQEGFIKQVASQGGPLIVGSSRFGQHLGHVVLKVRRGEDGAVSVQDAEVRVAPVANMTPDPESAPLVSELMKDLCQHLDRGLGRATMKKELSYPDFMTYLAQIMRQATHSEIALINDSAVANSSFPASGAMTKELVLRAIRSESNLGTLTIKGAELITLLEPHIAGKKGLRVIGLVLKGEDWLVNSRPLVSGLHYRVATTTFIAAGGDGLITAPLQRFEDSGLTMREQALSFFEKDGQDFDGDPAVELEKDFPDLWSRWLLYTRSTLGVAFSMVRVENGGAGDRYSSPPLKRANVTALEFNGALNGGLSNRNHMLEGDLVLQYGKTWTREQGASETVPLETLDRIKANLLYSLAYFKNRKGPGHWYVPEPYVEATLRSEFTPSGSYEAPGTGVAEEYHYLDLAGTLGAGWLIHPKLFVKLGFSMRDELLTLGEGGRTFTGIFLGYTLRRLDLITSETTPLYLESRLDYTLDDLSDTLRQQLTLESKLSFSFLPPLAFTATHRLFMYDTNQAAVSYANDVTVGLSVTWDRRRQTF